MNIIKHSKKHPPLSALLITPLLLCPLSAINAEQTDTSSTQAESPPLPSHDKKKLEKKAEKENAHNINAKEQTPQEQNRLHRPTETTPTSNELLQRARALRQRDKRIEQARQILQKTEDDVDAQSNLNAILNATEREYSLVKKGSFNAVYSFAYSYFSDDRLDIGFDDETVQFTRFAVERDAQHTLSHTLGIDYGVRNNINLGVSLPFLSKYAALQEESLTAYGDLSLRIRWQPKRVRVGEASSTLFSSLTLPTGRSPYEIDVDDELSSGSGLYSISMGYNVSKVIDPVVAFGTLSVSYSFAQTNLDQIRSDQILEAVDPGASFSFGMGLVYALSYDVSLTLQYQQSYSAKTDFVFNTGTQTSIGQNSALLNIGTSWRLRSDVIFSLGVGIGQTRESPDILISSTLPISYSGIVNRLTEYLPSKNQ